MTTGKIDLCDLREEMSDAVLAELIIGAGAIAASFKELPQSARRTIWDGLKATLALPKEICPDGAKFLVEAVLNSSSTPGFNAWLLNYIGTLSKHD